VIDLISVDFQCPFASVSKHLSMIGYSSMKLSFVILDTIFLLPYLTVSQYLESILSIAALSLLFLYFASVMLLHRIQSRIIA